MSVVYRFIAKTLVDAYRSCTLPPSAKFRVQNARLTSSRDGSEDGVAVNRGRQGRWNGGDGGPLFNRRGKGGEERKGSELGGNKVSLIPSLFFRQSSFLMEIARRGFLCNFFLLSFSFLFFLLFFFFIFIITGYQSPSLRIYRYIRRNLLEASERKRNFFYVS